MNVSPVSKILLIAAMLVAGWCGLSPLISQPAPVTNARVLADRFSAVRAMQSLAVIATEDGPSGSTRALAVRDYISQTISSLGLQPVLQDTTRDVYNADLGQYTHAVVHNVLARRSGRDQAHAVLVESDYDTAPYSPGASVSRANVAVALETMRVIQSDPALDHDIIFLFSDGGELGGQGTQAFASQHPWARDVAVSIVLKGLGSGGPSMLYAVTPGNSQLSAAALEVLPGRLASSWVNDLVWRLGGSAVAGLSQLPPAIGLLTIGDATVSQTARDVVGAVASGSIQSQGDNAVSLVRQLAGQNLASMSAQPEAAYFTLLPGVLVTYPAAVAFVPLLAGLVGLVLLIARGIRKGRVLKRDVIYGVVAWGLCLLATIVIVTLAWWLIRITNRNLHAFLVGITYQSIIYLIAFAGLSMMVCAGVYYFTQRIHMFNLAIGALLWWVAGGIVMTFVMPGSGYLFALPILPALVVMAWFILSDSESTSILVALLVISAVIVMMLFVPAIWLLNGLAAQVETATGLPLAALPAILMVFAFGILLPQLAFLTEHGRWLRVAEGGAIIFVFGILFAGMTGGFDQSHPRPNTVFYIEDADARTASWVTVDDSRAGRGTSAQRDEWTRQFIQQDAQTLQINPYTAAMTGDWPALRTGANFVGIPHPQ
ncbi:MAG TPA: M28 family peptidase, partial [Anaerolineae bacterium]